MNKEDIIENLEEQLLTLERLLYTIFKNDVPTDEEFEKYSKKFIKIRGDYTELFKEYESEDELASIESTEDLSRRFILENSDEKIKDFFEIIYNLTLICFKKLKLWELAKENKEIITSLEYILSKEEVKSHEEILDRLLKEEKIEDIIKYLKYLQRIIIEDFKRNITPVEKYVKGEDFKFLIHSVNYKEYDETKQENYTASSLLTPRHTQTYRSGYGFIMAPKNIICASSSDQHTDITAKSDDEVTFSVIPRIDSIGKIEEECTNYSEVLLKEFNPIGIFCLTDGSKTLNLNYLRAQKLRERFPNLPLVDIDLTLYKEDLTEIRNSLINHINAKLGIYTEVNYDDYKDFFEAYLSLDHDEITEEELLDLYTSYQKRFDNKKNM